MTSPMFSARLRTVLAGLGLVVVAGCDAPAAFQPVPEEGALLNRHTDPQAELLKAVRQATARFNSPVQAEKSGYLNTQHCVSHPFDPSGGAMGVHWINEAVVDPHFDPLVPEALLYEPGPNGQYRLTGVEYIVIDVGQEHPTFAGYPLDVGGTPVPVPHYSLHVWLYRDNPDGIFEPFNRNVSCD
jgi:hypothetical protein